MNFESEKKTERILWDHLIYGTGTGFSQNLVRSSFKDMILPKDLVYLFYY